MNASPAAFHEQLDDECLIKLGAALRARGYAFTTVTPETHRRVNARRGNEHARDLRDVFGWNRNFYERDTGPDVFALLQKSNALVSLGVDRWRSAVRFSTLGDFLFVHSAFPTNENDSVFFGPDTYRFVSLVRDELARAGVGATRKRIVDIGAGSGAGGIIGAHILSAGCPVELFLGDVNPRAVQFSRVNATLANRSRVHCVESDVLSGVCGAFDLIVANPPYMLDAGERVYRHGGSFYGCELSLRIVREALDRLAPGGRLILYTGAAIVAGVDLFKTAIVADLEKKPAIRFRYFELDPDVFGDELDRSAYAEVERIAAVALIVINHPD